MKRYTFRMGSFNKHAIHRIKDHAINLLVITFLLLGLSSALHAKPPNSVESIVWGGGGAFTGTSLYKGALYLSSDVSGVWKQVDGSWVPFVDGLTNYNVTSLVVFNDLLFAITTDELLYTDGESAWVSTGIKLNTYRSTTDQPFAVSSNGEQLCVASRTNEIDCIGTDLEHSSYTVLGKMVKGLFFEPKQNSKIMYYDNKQLYKLDMLDSTVESIHTFSHSIVSIFTFEGHVLVATNKKIFNAQNFEEAIYSQISANVINAFAVSDNIQEQILITTGSKWNTTLYSLEMRATGSYERQKVTIDYDLSLPHRKNQTNLTKLLGIKKIGSTAYVTDYWGVYAIKSKDELSVAEVSLNAHNVVATDLIVADNFLYVSTMDNGVIKIPKTRISKKRSMKEAISFDTIKGHAWSMLYFNKTLYTVFSPWNSANDFLFKFSEVTGEKSVEPMTDYDKRASRGAFWGNAYSRKLAYYYGIVSFRDGSEGGLVKETNSLFDMGDSFRFGEFNRVYNALLESNGLLYIATCEHPATVIAINQEYEPIFSIRLPNGFCAFSAYKHGGILYFLGAMKGHSVIYTVVGKNVKKFADIKQGSAFYSMLINPTNNDQIAIATNSWSNKSTSKLLVSLNKGEEFIDQTCVLSHRNGVVSINFDATTLKVYVLQKVGGLLEIPSYVLFSKDTCKEAVKT